MKKILITTTESLQGYDIETYIKPVFANVVVGAGFLSDFNASITDLFGGRSNSYEKKLQAINESALNILMSKAKEAGANCIIGLKVDMDQISGKNVQMFMVTAYGTAVVAKGLSTPKVVSSNEADKGTIADKANVVKLLKSIQIPTYQLSTGGLKVIAESKSIDFMDFMFKRFRGHALSHDVDSDLTQTINKLFAEYFSSIDNAASINTLYNGLSEEKVTKVLFAVAELIIQLDLVDYSRCIQLLKNDSFELRKITLPILKADKAFYVLEDISDIQAAIIGLQEAFQSKATSSTKKGFLSSAEKEIWVCECGKSNSLEIKHCHTCMKDKYGFQDNELLPSTVIELLQDKAEALKEFFNGRAGIV